MKMKAQPSASAALALLAQQMLVLQRRIVAQIGRDTGLEATGRIRRQVVEEFAYEGALQDVAVEVPLQEVGLRRQGGGNAEAPGMREGGGLVLDADGRIDPAHGIGAERGKLCQPVLTFCAQN